MHLSEEMTGSLVQRTTREQLLADAEKEYKDALAAAGARLASARRAAAEL
jgi:hypothetical protein